MLSAALPSNGIIWNNMENNSDILYYSSTESDDFLQFSRISKTCDYISSKLRFLLA